MIGWVTRGWGQRIRLGWIFAHITRAQYVVWVWLQIGRAAAPGGNLPTDWQASGRGVSILWRRAKAHKLKPVLLEKEQPRLLGNQRVRHPRDSFGPPAWAGFRKWKKGEGGLFIRGLVV